MQLAGDTGMLNESRLTWGLFGLGLAAMYLPTFYELSMTLWASDQQGQGPVVLALAAWLIWRARHTLDSQALGTPRPVLGWGLVAIALLLYVIGRSQGIWLFEIGSLIPLLSGCVLLVRGAPQLRTIWFALFFMLFMIPLPGPLVAALTQPMKQAVSWAVEHALYALGYPISRTGVMLQIGPYELLVADACAGLNTLFTLEAIGLLYMNVVRYSSALRNIVLATLIVPISFLANVIRVSILCLITYHLGDEAGQGFLHGFAGMVLFLSALCLIIGADSLLRFAGPPRQPIGQSA
jgi:exosortase B